MSELVTRRQFVELVMFASGGLLAACQPSAPAAVPAPAVSAQPPAAVSPAPAQPGWQKEWDDTVAAAKREGRLHLNTPLGVGFRNWVEVFEKTFPGIHVELLQTTSINEFGLKLFEERKAGLFEWDVFHGQASIALTDFRPQGVLDPVRPVLINRPDVFEDRYWRDGFEAGWQDSAKELGIAHSASVAALVGINTDLVSEDEIKTVPDLLNPKWKGQILMSTYSSGAVFAPMHAVRLKYGEAAVRSLLIDQEPVIIRSNEQIVEFLVRGRYPIAGAGATREVLQKYVDEGVAKHVKLVDVPDYSYVIQACLWLINRAPHPNAAKLFLNWTLTKEGNEAYAKNVQANGRRTDIATGDLTSVPKPGQAYMTTGLEQNLPDVNRTRALTEELAKLRT